jgi:phospholipase C
MAQKRVIAALAVATCAAGGGVAVARTHTGGHPTPAVRSHQHRARATRTPIKHVVVIYQENVSFDHYFGTYPRAANTDGQRFTPAPGTPAVDGLLPATSPSLPPALRHSSDLTRNNPNRAQPQRLDSSAAGATPGQGQLSCDQDHNYSDEQKAFDNGRMDLFVQSVGNGGGSGPTGAPCSAAQVMDYFDGNTVTGLWNYAQHFAISDNSFGTTFGPSTPGAINLASGDTGNVDMAHTANSPSISTATSPNGDLTANGKGGFSLTNDAQPYWDDCSVRDAVAFSGQNIGDVLNRAGLSWGWFEGGFKPTITYDQGKAAVGATGQPTSTFIPDQFRTVPNPVPHSSNQGLCDNNHPIGVALGGTGQYGYKDDYIPHHEPFQYYASTANPHHLGVARSASGSDSLAGLRSIGHDTQSYKAGAPQFNTPNHNYDMSDFEQLVAAINAHKLPGSALPAVSFLKAPGYQDGHAGYSDPADEQRFIVNQINALQRTPEWRSTVVVVAYDDSDGWYDHAYSGVHNPSLSPADNLTDTTLTGPPSGKCGPSPQRTAPLGGEQGRCGFGPRLPFLVISPLAKANAVDHHLSNQASIINMVEYNWDLPGISGSADQLLASQDARERIPFDLAGMFSFGHSKRPRRLFLNPDTGQPRG